MVQRVGVFLNGGDIQRIRCEHRRNKQGLRTDLPLVECILEFFVQDTLVRRVHIDEHQALGALGQNIDTVQLRQGVAERGGDIRVAGLVDRRGNGRHFQRGAVECVVSRRGRLVDTQRNLPRRFPSAVGRRNVY